MNDINNETLIKNIMDLTKLNSITDIFLFGSKTYNTYNKDSDYDFIVLSNEIKKNGQQYNNLKFNITVYSIEHFQEKLNENKPFAIECINLPFKFKLINKTKFILKLKNFNQEYKNKIKEDEKKLLKEINFNKRIKIKLFIKKLELHLISLIENKEFEFDLKIYLEEIRKNEVNLISNKIF